MLKNTGNNQEIKVITLKNIDEYIDIPYHIKNKFEQNKISMALYSDFIRIALLSQYGGFWIDATVLVTENIENLCDNYNFYTKKSDMAEFPLVRKMFDELPINDNGRESKLNEKIDDNFDKNLYSIYLNNMSFQKLSYKSNKFLKILNSKETFYGHIYNEYGEANINEQK